MVNNVFLSAYENMRRDPVINYSEKILHGVSIQMSFTEV
jgi:hypothetical protein